MIDLPLELIYPTDKEIKVHLAAGRYYGRDSTCGTKVKHSDFLTAHKHAASLMKSRKKSFEAYPCYFCSPDINNATYTWHVGRSMEEYEWDAFWDSAEKILDMEDVTLVGGQTLRVHNSKMCQGRNCCIHNPSDHHMTAWPQNWRADAKKMERLCPHGVGHPDPDDVAFNKTIKRDVSVHGCDGCCLEGNE